MMHYCTKKGFSLIETLIYTALFILMVSTLNTFILNLLSTNKYNEDKIEVDMQGTRIVYTINRELRNAKQIVTPALGNSNNSIVFIDSNSATTTISFLNNKLYMQKNSGNLIPLDNDKVKIVNINFANQSYVSTEGLIRYNFTISNFNQNYSKNFYGGASLK